MSSTWDADGFRSSVQAALDAFLDAQAALLAPLGADAARLLDQARASVTGGKRFRAAFCYWGHRAFAPAGSGPSSRSGAPSDEATLVRACSSLELLHASALVHDDLMDASDTRRGRPSAHRVLEAQHRQASWRGDPEQYGAAGAILLGDILQAWADEMLRGSGFPVDLTLAALGLFDVTRSEVIAGQFLDVSVQARARASVETAMTVLRYKSAKYSIERPLHIGAALAGAAAQDRQALSAFGLPLGEAFQLRDDLLGVYGDPATTGKPAGDDLVEGKRTVLVALALEGASAADADLLDGSLGRPLTDAEVERIRAIITSSGAQARVEKMISALYDEAVAALEAAPIDDRARGVLRGLASAATQRAL